MTGTDPLNRALCRVEGHPTWWDDEILGETDRERARRHAKAKAVCARCPAIVACAKRFDPALDAGVWFGVVHDRRRTVAVSHNTGTHLGKRPRRTA